MKHKDILLTWEEFLVILLVHFVVSAKEFSTRTSYIVIYIYIYVRKVSSRHCSRRKYLKRKIVPEVDGFMDSAKV